MIHEYEKCQIKISCNGVEKSWSEVIAVNWILMFCWTGHKTCQRTTGGNKLSVPKVRIPSAR